MEESYFIASLQTTFRSRTLMHLEAELYDFDDKLLLTLPLFNARTAFLPIQIPLKSFYFRIIDQDHEISELFSYFWPGGQVKEETMNLTESYENFIIEIDIEIKQRQDEPSGEPSETEVDARQYLQRIKQRVFDALQGQNFFADENSRVKCNFIRKNKTHKNLTALLIKNSTNILKKINQNVSTSAAKTYANLKTNQTNETADQITLELLPPIDKMKKTNSVQYLSSEWHQTDSIHMEPSRVKDSTILEKKVQQKCDNNGKRSRLKKYSIFVRGKQGYEKKLEKETLMDLRNQKETLNVIRSYISSNVKTDQPTHAVTKISRKSRTSAQRTRNTYKVAAQNRRLHLEDGNDGVR